MMLQALIRYAERESIGDADFREADIRWLVPIDMTGGFSGTVIDWSENAGSKRPRPRKVMAPYTRGDDIGHGRSNFLFDNLERAVGLVSGLTAEKAALRQQQFEHFKSLLKLAAEKCPSEASRLNALVHALDDASQLKRIQEALGEQKAKSNESVTFQVSDVLLYSQEIKGFWRSYRASQANPKTSKTARRAAGRLVQCLATGALTKPTPTTRKVKGIPGGQPSGTNLISFDKPSFTSFRLKKALNAAISTEADVKICSALDDLVRKGLKLPDPSRDPLLRPLLRRPTQRKRKAKLRQVVVIHWTRQKMERQDPLDLLVADEATIRNYFEAPYTGTPQPGVDADRYYAMSLTGNGGRIVVRDWLESTVQDVESSVRRWFEDLKVLDINTNTVRNAFTVNSLLWAMGDEKLQDPFAVVPEGATEKLLRSALTGYPKDQEVCSAAIPLTLLDAALRRERVDRVSRDEETGKSKSFFPPRFALIKACLLRNQHSRTTNHQQTNDSMTECLNPQSRDPGYLCGRLLAVFDRLQYLALGELSASLVERYYGSASSTPALVMGRLFRNAQFHLQKAGEGLSASLTPEQKQAIAENVLKEIEAITCALGDAFPVTLDLEGQGRFALGYYHQKAEYRRRSAERKTADVQAKAQQLADETL